MKNKKTILILLTLFFVNLLLRLTLISKGPYHSDCLYLALKAETMLTTKQLAYLQGSGLPLTAVLGAIFVFITKLFSISNPVFAVNLMSVFFSSLSIPMLYLLVKKLFGPKAAILSAIILSIKPSFLAISTFGNSHTPSIFFLLLAFYFLFSYREKHLFKYLFFSALSFGLSGAARLQDLVPMMFAITYLVFMTTSEKEFRYNRLKNLLLFFTILLGTILIFYIKMLVNIKPNSTGSIFSNYFQSHIFDTFKNIPLDRFPAMTLVFLLTQTLVGAAAFLAGMIMLYRKNKKLFIFFCLWASIPFYTYVCLNYARPRSFLIPSIAAIIVQGLFFSQFMKKNRILHLSPILIILISVLMNFTRVYPLLKFRHEHELLPEYFRWVSKITEDNAEILERDHSLFIKHYAKRKALGSPVSMYYLKKERLEKFQENIDSKLKKKVPLYITGYGLYGYPPDANFDDFMFKNYFLQYVGKHLTEDWHRGSLVKTVVYNVLYKINPKKNK